MLLFTWNLKSSRITNAVSLKNEVRGQMLSDFKANYKTYFSNQNGVALPLRQRCRPTEWKNPHVNKANPKISHNDAETVQCGRQSAFNGLGKTAQPHI